MCKTYQSEKIDTNQPAMPEMVGVALAELAGEVREGLLALAVGAGLQVMVAMMEAGLSVRLLPGSTNGGSFRWSGRLGVERHENVSGSDTALSVTATAKCQ